MKLDGVAETQAGYGLEGDDEYEHRFAEHQQESATKPEPTDGLTRRIGSGVMVG